MNHNIDEKVKELLNKMTLIEKVGQLQQCGPTLAGAFEVSFEELLNMMFDGKISREEFDQMMSTAQQDYHEDDLRAGKIGSYNGVSDAETALRLQRIAVEESRCGIPLMFGFDVVHGHRTVTPIPLAESCAWEPDLWKRTARMAAEEATASGINMTFAPMVDVAKDARWGRICEGAGEDAWLNGQFGAAKVKGFQGKRLSDPDSMAACVKHLAGYGAVESGRDYNRVDMSMQRLFEEYLPSYQACAQAGAKAFMPAFNDLSGVPCTVNPWLLKDILRDDWHFDGVVVSDSNAISECVVHGIAEDRADAARQAVEAGVDVDMSSNCYIENMEDLVKSGKVSIEYLDKAVSNVLKLKYELGLFDNPYQTSALRGQSDILTDKNRKLAGEAAWKSMVLLKNDDGILPLEENQTVGLIGELAYERGQMLGSWSIAGKEEDCISIADAFRNRGLSFELFDNADAAIRSDCGIIIAAVGEDKDSSGEAASRASVTVPEKQLHMLEKLTESGKKVVTVLFNGRPLAIPWIAENTSAILEAWYPGIEAGNAILDILYGIKNPCGKLTASFPYVTGQCPIYYGHINTGRPAGKSKYTSKYLDAPVLPLYPFGYGLSFTEYEYMELHITSDGENIVAELEVQNIGNRDGDEIVQCYIHDVVAKRVRPVKKLVDFCKIHLSAGESKKVRFIIPYQKLGYYDSDMKYVVEDGEFEIFVGKNSEDCIKERILWKNKVRCDDAI